MRRPRRPELKTSPPLDGATGDANGPGSPAALPTPGTESTGRHPLAPLADSYADEPLWEEFLAAIREYREEVNRAEEAVD